MPEVLILGGPPGAGKSSVAEALAERYDRVAHIDVDTLRHFVTPTGYVAPGRPGFEHQQQIAMHNAATLAANFLTERFAVIIDDVIVASEDLSAYVELLRPCGVPVHYVRLLPSLEVCLLRNQQRSTGRVRASRIEEVWRAFEADGNVGGSTIDSTALSVYETADKLQGLTTSGASIVWQPGAD